MRRMTIKGSTLGQRITDARERLDINLSELARRVGVSRAAVTQWEQDNTEPSSGNLRKLASVLGVPLEWLGQGRGSPLPVRNTASTMADGERIDLKAIVNPDHARILAASLSGKNAEVWRLTTNNLFGAGYSAGDFLVVDVSATGHSRDIVLAETSRISIFRLYLPPYLYCLTVDQQPAPLTVDNVTTRVRGVVIARFSF